MDKFEIQRRAMKIAFDVIKFTKMLPASQESKVISYQVIKSSTSTASNYQSAGRGKSMKDFIAKLGIAEEECDETLFWLELIEEAKLADPLAIQPFKKESSEILAIIVASIKTAKLNLSK